MVPSYCGRTTAALALVLLGLPPAFAMDRVATAAGGGRGAPDLAARPCPTGFDYLVLASFADGPSLLSLSTYHFAACHLADRPADPAQGGGLAVIRARSAERCSSQMT